VFLCFIKHSTVKAYYELDVYIPVFLTTALDIDVPLNTTSDSYITAGKMPVRAEYEEWWESGLGGIGQGKIFLHI